MKIYFAPMEGITGYTFRNIYDENFPGVDRYYTPFIAATHTHSCKTREKKDVAPENNRVKHLVPQVLTNKSEDFLWSAGALADLGYSEVNLNLGCPSPTVVSKKKGAGFLGEPDMLDRFFEETFEGLRHFETAGRSAVRISVKTRIGMRDTEEAAALMGIFNRYPLAELIIHPRLQNELYRGVPHADVFLSMLGESRNPVCFNGDICTPGDMERLLEAVGKKKLQLPAVMIGRGFLRDPALLRRIQGGQAARRDELQRYHDRLLEAYSAALSPKDALFRMKELWAYLQDRFDGEDRRVKRLLKCRDSAAFRAAADELFAEGTLR